MRILGSDDIGAMVIEMVRNAEECVCMASAWMTGGAVEGIIRNIPEGVRVQVVIRASEFTDLKITDDRVFALFREKGAGIFLNDRLHAKFIVVDGREAVVGSANVTMSGYSPFDRGNIEAAVYYSREDDEEQIRGLVEYFERILETSYPLNDSLVGYVINPSGTRNLRAILLDHSVGEHTFVEIGDGILGRIDYIKSYSAGFFNNPFEDSYSDVYAPTRDFVEIFSHDRDMDWMRAAAYSYLNERARKVRIASISIVGRVGKREDGKYVLEPLRIPADVGEPVYVSGRVAHLLTERGVAIGKLFGTGVPVEIDHRQILRKHMLVLGNTGSGKSYFTKLFIKKLADKSDDVGRIVVLDPHGEYARAFAGEDEEGRFRLNNLAVLRLRDVFFVDDVDDVLGFLTGYGAVMPSANSEVYRRIHAAITGWLRDVSRDIQQEILGVNFDKYDYNRETIEKAFESMEEEFGGDFFDRVQETRERIEEHLEMPGVVVFDLNGVTEPVIRTHLAGFIMRKLFLRARKDESYKALIVLEEAHNFAPEKGYGEISAGKDNLALTYARKIASEGRKFGVGLITITQRPAQVSKYVLAQMNTQVMFRTVNSQDIDAVREFIEFAGEDIVSILPALKTGTGIMTGTALPFPVVVDVG